MVEERLQLRKLGGGGGEVCGLDPLFPSRFEKAGAWSAKTGHHKAGKGLRSLRTLSSNGSFALVPKGNPQRLCNPCARIPRCAGMKPCTADLPPL